MVATAVAVVQAVPVATEPASRPTASVVTAEMPELAVSVVPVLEP